MISKSTQLSVYVLDSKELQGIHTGGSSSFNRYEWAGYVWPIV